MQRATAVFVAVLAALTAACGSTVQSAQRTTSGGDGLSAATEGRTSESSAEAEGTSTVGGAAVTGPAGAAAAARAAAGTAAGQPTGAAAAKAVTGPIQLGFVNTNVSNAAAFGIEVGSTLSNQQIYDALIAEMNKAGGINGRKIEPVYGDTDTASASWNTDFQAACEKFTRDNHVAAVLGYVFVWLDAFEGCLAKAGVPHLYGGYQPGDRQLQREFPLVVSTTHPDVESQWLTVVGGAITSGRLTPSNRLGLFVDDCAHGNRAFNAVVPAYLKAHKITYEVFETGCSSGSSDNGKAASEIEAAALRFRSHGVDTVAIGGVPLLLFATHAESQAWHPSYITSVGGAAFEGNVPAAQLRNFHGFSWIPAVDVNASHQPAPPNAAQKRCLSMLAAQGIRPAGTNDYMLAYTSCDALFMYAAALQRTNGHADSAAVVSALTATAPAYQSAATYGGRVQVSNAQRGGAAVWREWGYADDCSCFVYKGNERPMSW
jgi:ABC-type branched-subunit amino acid transport system substrate-binding protein